MSLCPYEAHGEAGRGGAWGQDEWDTGPWVPQRPYLLHTRICHCQAQLMKGWNDKKTKQCPWLGQLSQAQTPSFCSCNRFAGAHGDSVHVPLDSRIHSLGPLYCEGRK